MKLKNKKTGEIHEITEVVPLHDMDKKFIIYSKTEGHNHAYKNLAELNAEWEDYEEQKEWYWFIEDNGIIQRSCHYEDLHPTLDKARKEIGNYFETREEAEKAVKKLKAWKRLKDGGFKFTDWYRDICEVAIDAEIHDEGTMGMIKDLDLLFGGEE